MRIRFIAAVVLGGALIISLGAGAMLATGTIGGGEEHSPYEGCDLPADFDKFPPEKQALELAERAECEEAKIAPHASKEPDTSPVLSCPTDPATLKPSIYPYNGGPFGRNMVNEALVVGSKGTAYRVFAGALELEPQQGVLIVQQMSLDPCAAAAGLTPTYEPKTYEFSAKSGAVTLTSIEGDTVVFEAASGEKGRFDYTTGEFLSP